ncbi:MAG TPA: transglutaminase family protein [Polyangia bacterium]
MRYKIRHLTRYRYSEAVTNSQHDLHLVPRALPHQRCLFSELEIRPAPSVCQERVDYFGNRAAHMVLASAHAELAVIAHSRVEVTAPDAIAPDQDVAWEAAVSQIAHDLDRLTVLEMTFPSPYIALWEDLRAYARSSFPDGQPVLKGCIDLMARVHGDFAYDAKATTVATPLDEVFHKRRGVCQDFAHLMIACLRSLGLAARYVSGYLATTPPPGKARLVGADASHAWLSVFLPRFGFMDIDPTNNVLVGDQHITLAIGRDFGDVTPLRGVVLGGGRHDLEVAVDVLSDPVTHC